jgi:hypothetical protein
MKKAPCQMAEGYLVPTIAMVQIIVKTFIYLNIIMVFFRKAGKRSPLLAFLDKTAYIPDMAESEPHTKKSPLPLKG